VKEVDEGRKEGRKLMEKGRKLMEEGRKEERKELQKYGNRGILR
jgi:hypothetical protein